KMKPRIEECTVSLLNFVIGVQAPFTMVESSWFHEMMSTLDPCYVPPTRTYIKERIMSQFQAQRLDFLVTKHQLGYMFLNKDEWKNIDVIISLLYSILQATELLSSSSYPTMSD
ncbi:128_t:CDS:2, partial [Dentiscutata heterogama]